MPIESHLYQEIHQQPDVLERLLVRERGIIEELAGEIRRRKVTHVVIAARGTSDNAGRYAQYVLCALNQLTVALATPSLFTIYQQPPNFGKALVLGISQSGMSPDIVSVLAEAKKQNVLTAAITNDRNSNLAQESDFVIDLGAGKESSVAATKTYTSELGAVALLSGLLSNNPNRLSELVGIPEAVAQTLKMNKGIEQIAPRYRYMDRSIVIGRGFNYSTAFELSLKLKELTYTIVEPYSSADFLHGPFALIDSGFPVIVVAPSGKMESKMVALMESLIERQAELVVISDVIELLSLARVPLQLPKSVPEWLSPITAIIPGQLLAMHLAHTRDFDVDSPRGLKKVTETH